MGSFVRSVRGYTSLGIGLVACPCHLPLTLSLLLSLTAGTAFSAWLAAHTALVYGLSTLMFIGGTVLGVFWLNTNRQCQLEKNSGIISRPSKNELLPSHEIYRPEAKG